jgi:uncharacterized membrane protein YoaT (DUF817 family)
MIPPARPAGGATRGLEHRLGDGARGRLPGWAVEPVLFVLKQGWACLFGGLLLAAIIATKLVWQPDWPVARYDALLVFALATQAVFLRARLETWEEARVILLFHLTGTLMEWFKVAAGSWAYPEPALFKVMQVPLFSGFMYAAVGSYMVRVIRGFDMVFAPFPPAWMLWALAAAIYVNFFAHHALPDLRAVLIPASVVLFLRTRIWFRTDRRFHWMPLPVAAGLAAVALWVAENVGTATQTWLYAGQRPGEWVSPAKLGSWYMLLYVAFATVTVAGRGALRAAPWTPPPEAGTAAAAGAAARP